MPAAVHPLLSPYVSPAPQGCLTLVTSVLDATSNWLLLRYVHAALNGEELADNLGSFVGSGSQEPQESFKVVFVSILRDFEQWREMGKKMVCKLVFLRLLECSDSMFTITALPSLFCTFVLSKWPECLISRRG
jgi:hypothetical protein